VQVSDSLGRVNHSNAGSGFVTSIEVSDDSSSLFSTEFLVDGSQDGGESVVRVSVNSFKSLSVLGESILEITLDSVSEENGVGFLHHGGFEMERQEHAGVFGVLALKIVEFAESFLAHESRVNDLSLQERGNLLEDGSLSRLGDVLNAYISSVAHDHGLFIGVEISGSHVANVGLAGTRPGEHSVRVGSSPLLDGISNTSVGITFTEDGVDGRSEDLSVSLGNLLFSIIFRFRRVVRDSESFSL